MRTKTIGEVLQGERLKYRVTLPDFAERTRIKQDYLQALEENRFADLPAATFVKGFIRAYANHFQFDYQPVLGLLRRDYKESASGKLVPREFIKPLLKQRQVWTPVTFTLIGLTVVFVILFGYVALQWYAIQRPPRLEIFAPEDRAVESSPITVKGETSIEAIVAVNDQPVALQPDGQFQTEVVLPRAGLHTIIITASDRRGRKTTVERTIQVKEASQ